MGQQLANHNQGGGGANAPHDKDDQKMENCQDKPSPS